MACRNQDYHYERLRDTQNGIRLARIKPGSGSKRIAIDLVEAWLPKSGQRCHDEYDALSDTWGNGERTKIILCNGRPSAITTNLLEALHRFRDSIQYVTLWIDQICIWQDSLAE
ncbi:Putative heterokaryon incompatibility [Septoria linicola]|uniref:Heterokaryon incompatibility n=1 Tax=Septoria linicola TaxID=215465 RepID=A0A9Q9AM69_9PEZI|nr:putative heterokaryon incompatibility [Septoria linicola]USW48486.1 Putative heterokaryon incompatibility [Septoria linicola]